MTFLKDAFTFRKPKISDLENELKKLNKDRLELQQEIDFAERKRQKAIEKAKDARKNENQAQVDYYYNEYQTAERERNWGQKQSRVVQLETIATRKYILVLKTVERAKNPKTAKKFIQRMHNLRMKDKMMHNQAEEDAYLDEMQAIMRDLDVEFDNVGIGTDDDDAEKKKFLEEIDEIIVSEDELQLEEKAKNKPEKEAEEPVEDENNSEA